MLCTSGFVDDITFTHSKANGQNQRQRVCFVDFTNVTSQTSDNVVWSASPGDGTSSELWRL